MSRAQYKVHPPRLACGPAAALMLTLLAWAPAAVAQLVTGAISGRVTDSTGSVVAGAVVRMASEATGAARTLTADQNGAFVFTGVQPGTYTLTVEHPGFKKFEKKQLTLTANENLAAGEIRLELGNVTDSITVRAEGANVQVASGERSGVITREEVENLTLINRDFQVLISLQPGVVLEPGAEVQTFGSNSSFYALGGRNTSNSISLDGISTENTNGINSNTYISMDAVQTVKVMVSNFQAEFGRKPGASVQAISKSGTKQFHGMAYYYKRHEMFNANNFFNNSSGVAQTPYRYMTAGYNIGGPVTIPGLFNGGRDKLFFFFSQEHLREARPQTIRQYTVPTLAERAGNFSDSRDTNGALIVIRDPFNNRLAFPGNIIPANRLNKNTQKYLNLLPVPNALDPAVTRRTYNWQFQESVRYPKRTEMARVDYNIGPKTMIYSRFTDWDEDSRGNALAQVNTNWGWMPASMHFWTKSLMASATRIVSPSTILEASWGFQRLFSHFLPIDEQTLASHQRKTIGWDVPQFYPQYNEYDLLPRATFSGRTGAISTNYNDSFPWRQSWEMTYNTNVSVSKTTGAHVSKAGFFWEYWDAHKRQQGMGNSQGRFGFDKNTSNPYDTNDPFSNALLGVFATYTESTSRPSCPERQNTVEWYVQDNWKVSRRLTLDLGIRFGWAQPFYTQTNAEAGFVPERWVAADAAALIRPAMVNGVRSGIDPLSGKVYPAAVIGLISPLSKNPLSATVNRLVETSYPRGLRYNSGLKLAPRFGFAYDPFGRGRTAIRGGFGIFRQLKEVDNFGKNLALNPPLQFNPTVYYGTLDTLGSQQGLNSPSDTTGFQARRAVATVMNFSFGIQHNIGFGTVVDVSYVGAQSRHLTVRRNLNSVPAGTTFLPSSTDPTTGRALSTNFLRPYPGYANILYYTNDSTSNYNSMQVSGNRRFARGLQFGLAWTWSKAMDYVDSDDGTVSLLVNPRVWNYGKAGFDRTHIVRLSWTWDVPRGSKLWPNAVTRHLLDGWQLSGIETFQSGAPTGIGAPSFNYTTDITGSPTDSARVVVLRNPVLPKSQRTFSRNFDPAAFGPPAIGTFGNAPKDVFRGPGINNWDVSVFKRIRTGSERWRMQLRGEFYNLFNHTQFSSVYTSIQFDRAGTQMNSRLGEFTAARQPRRVQLALRLSF